MFDVEDVISTSLAHSFPYNLTCSCGCGVISNGTTSYVRHGKDCIGAGCVNAWIARGYRA